MTKNIYQGSNIGKNILLTWFVRYIASNKSWISKIILVGKEFHHNLTKFCPIHIKVGLLFILKLIAQPFQSSLLATTAKNTCPTIANNSKM